MRDSPPSRGRSLLAYGFARAYCEECGHDFLIAFSCKGRGYAVHRISAVSVRRASLQWYETFPLACPVCGAMTRIIAFDVQGCTKAISVKKTYRPACLFVRLRRCGNRYIVRLCAYRHALKTNENPAQSGMLFSVNRLMPREAGCRERPSPRPHPSTRSWTTSANPMTHLPSIRPEDHRTGSTLMSRSSWTKTSIRACPGLDPGTATRLTNLQDRRFARLQAALWGGAQGCAL
jgi:hypothetical protein